MQKFGDMDGQEFIVRGFASERLAECLRLRHALDVANGSSKLLQQECIVNLGMNVLTSTMQTCGV
jgi:hypothetical protein